MMVLYNMDNRDKRLGVGNFVNITYVTIEVPFLSFKSTAEH